MKKRTKQSGSLPSSVVKRLTRYLTLAQNLSEQEEEWVSSKVMADHLGLTSSTVRQDLSHLDFSGISKKGYEVERLKQVLTEVLGADKEWKCVVVGAGNLGTAIAHHGVLGRRGFVICGLFDTDAKRVGAQEGPIKVMHVSELPSFAKKEKVEIGILAVPAAAAQVAADDLINAGVKGLLNLSVTHINVPAGVSVVGSRMVSNLLELTHAIMSA